jgi:hypothetical protein
VARLALARRACGGGGAGLSGAAKCGTFSLITGY